MVSDSVPTPGWTTVVVELDLSGVDVGAEQRRLEKVLAVAEKELAGTRARLDNKAFLAKAPANVVDKIRERHQFAQEEVDRIKNRLAPNDEKRPHG